MPRPVVLVAIKGLGIGGAEQLILEGARHWNRDLFEYQVAYALPWKDQLVGPLESLGIPVHLVGSQRGLTPMTILRLRNLAKSVGASLLHAHLPLMGVAARLASGFPVIYTEHNIADSYRAPTKLVNRVTYALNRRVTAVSEAVADSLTGYPGPRPIVIPNGVECHVDSASADRVRSELEIAMTTPLIVQVGNIRPHKGHETLIRAAAIIKSTHPGAVIVAIGGEKHEGDLVRVRELAEVADVSDMIRFLGRRSDAHDFIAAANVFVNPSDVEGLPLVVLEAMSLGTPVVATAVGGVPKVVRDGDTGRLVPAKDPEQLAGAVTGLLDRPEEASAFAAAASELVSRAYSLEKMVLSYENLYAEVLDD